MIYKYIPLSFQPKKSAIMSHAVKSVEYFAFCLYYYTNRYFEPIFNNHKIHSNNVLNIILAKPSKESDAKLWAYGFF